MITIKEYLIKGAEFYENNRNTHIMLIDKSDESCEDTEAVCISEKIRRMLDEKISVSRVTENRQDLVK